MAMIKCSSCGRDVSDQVETCLYCGNKITKGTSWVPLSSDGVQKNSGEWKSTGTQSERKNMNTGTGLSNAGGNLWEKFMGLSNSKKILTVFLVIFLGIPFLKGFFGAFSSYGSSGSRSYNYSSTTPVSSTPEAVQTTAEDDGKIAMPVTSSSLYGENYVDVEKILREAGFQNISMEPIDDLVTGWMVSDGDVEKVSMGGYTSFDTSSRFAADTEIVISYHTFPEDTDTKTVASVDDTDYLKEATDLLQSIYEENMSDIDYVKEATDLINSVTGSSSNGSGQIYQCIGIDFPMPDYYILEEDTSEEGDFLYFDDGIIFVFRGQSNNSDILDKDNLQEVVKEMGMDGNYKLTGDSPITVAGQSAELIEYEDKGGELDIIGAAVGIKNGNNIAMLVGMWEEANSKTYLEDFYQMLNNAKKSSGTVAGNSNGSNTNTSGMTMSQKNAVQSAKDYLEFMAFSRKGLIEQLSSQYGDGYSVADATFAVDYLENNGLVDWNEQAKRSAQQYLSIMSFSKQGLIDQLTSDYGDGFTKEQAEYAVRALGY